MICCHRDLGQGKQTNESDSFLLNIFLIICSAFPICVHLDSCTLLQSCGLSHISHHHGGSTHSHHTECNQSKQKNKMKLSVQRNLQTGHLTWNIWLRQLVQNLLFPLYLCGFPRVTPVFSHHQNVYNMLILLSRPLPNAKAWIWIWYIHCSYRVG